jgi:hypothetical protein
MDKTTINIYIGLILEINNKKNDKIGISLYIIILKV